MFYQIDDKQLKKIVLSEVNEQSCVGKLSLAELKGLKDTLGIDQEILSACESSQAKYKNSIDSYDDYTFGILNIIDVHDLYHEKDRVAFLLKKDQFFFIELVDYNRSIEDMFEKVIARHQNNAQFEVVVAAMLSAFLQDGYEVLAEIDDEIIEVEMKIVEETGDSKLNKNIYELKDKTSVLKNYYHHLMEIGLSIQENENNLFTSKELHHIKIFTNRCMRLWSACQSTQEDLVHLRDALSSMLDYQLNRIMKLFTVVTTVFLPLTLIVGWYGMNFEYMPEISWRYGYIAVIILSAVVAVSCLYMFKKKKLM
ncbi:MAG: CorA family divalent cation transporter [Anaerorhabdus sp.]